MCVWIQCTDVGYLALLYYVKVWKYVGYHQLLSMLLCTNMLNGRRSVDHMDAFGEVAASLFLIKDLTTQKSAAEKCGREY